MLVDDIIPLVLDAGKAVMEVYNSDFSVDTKDDDSPVTKADLRADRILREGLAHYGYGFITEEHGVIPPYEKMWIIDPVDGTLDFVNKTGEFSIQLGLIEQGIPTLGIVYAPALDKLYIAQKGQGTYLIHKGEKTRLHVLENPLETMVRSRNHFTDEDKAFADELGIEKYIIAGSVGIKLGLIAEGKGDIYVNNGPHLKLWDVCAPQVILEEAGGVVSMRNGETIIYDTEHIAVPPGFVGSNRAF